MSEDLGYSQTIKESGDLIANNLPLIRYIVAKNCKHYLHEDAAQEAAIKMLQSAPKHNSKKAKFSTYLGICVRNKVIDMVKIDKRRIARVRQLRYNEDATSMQTPLDIIIQNEEKISLEQLHNAVQDLQLHERYVITFRHGLYDESPHTIREIGNMMKVPYGTAKSIEKRAYKKLRAALTDECA
jgi:RNA polymerase sigma factor (sigma-70 family)